VPDRVFDPDVTEPAEGTDLATTRRTLLRSAVLAGVATPILAACGGGDDEPSASSPSSSSPQGEDPAPSDGQSSQGGGGGGAADAIAKTSDVPEGGGVILADPGIVITQPAAGEFKGFTNICTHQSCPLDNVTDGTINCVCHGSQFSIEDGSPVTGPNGSDPSSIAALEEKPIAVQGDNISLA
jgi:nitrite reductase/ring-hydroxylating ferredoxin subunit